MKPTVLIVDDSLTVRMDLNEAFREAGLETTLCATLGAAREFLKQGTFSLVVLDVLLPDGDGLDLLKEIKKTPSTAALPVMLLSTEAEVRNRIEGLKTGADEYVGKPYDTAYVVSRANELIQRTAHEQPTQSRTRVLLIEDSATFREALKDLLESAQYAVISAVSGEEGLRKAAIHRPHIVIVDGQLPGIDGPTVIRHIRSDAALRHTPCVLLTASETHSNEVKALEAGADAYLRKESETSVILTRLAAVLRTVKGQTIAENVAGYLGPKKILAVDDSPTYLQTLSDELLQEGYDMVHARSGEEALELLSVQPVDCILLDLLMPGLSGQDTCKRIKGSTAWRDIPLIMLTAMNENDAMVAGMDAGADDYITKSADFEVLKARVRAQLRRKQFEDENRRIREQLLNNEIEATEARAAKELAETRAKLLADLKVKNQELESFSYSVSHDLRAPLRSIDGFSQALMEDHGEQLSPDALEKLKRVRTASQRMGQLIDDLLKLSRLTRSEMRRTNFDLSAVAKAVAQNLQDADPQRRVDVTIASGVKVNADEGLMRIVLENLIGNAWKFTSKIENPRIEFGTRVDEGTTVYFVRDNGAGFDMAYKEKLFGAFQRLHGPKDFPGTGIGLATVNRIVSRHGGHITAEAAVGKGATFSFTLG